MLPAAILFHAMLFEKLHKSCTKSICQQSAQKVKALESIEIQRL